jgi:uncharacterized damage-inducible protein DinB
MQEMTYYGPKELASALRTVRKNTIQIAEEIPEEKYSFSPTPDTRSVAQILVHVGMMPRFSKTLVGSGSFPPDFNFLKLREDMAAEEAKPRTKAELIEWLRETGEDYAAWVESLSDDYLGGVITFPAGAQPPTRTRFEMITSAKEHEMHHRAQLMLIERLLGITPHLTRQAQERFAAMREAQQAHRA